MGVLVGIGAAIVMSRIALRLLVAIDHRTRTKPVVAFLAVRRGARVGTKGDDSAEEASEPKYPTPPRRTPRRRSG